MSGWMIGWMSIAGVSAAFLAVQYVDLKYEAPLPSSVKIPADFFIRHAPAFGWIAWLIFGWIGVPNLPEGMVLTAMVSYAFLVVWSNRNVISRLPEETEHSPENIHARLVQLRIQLQRLHERERLSLRLERAEQSQNVLDRYEQRFQVILLAIEQHLTFGDHERAERIITLFARHLRHILHEGSTPFLSLADTLDHIKTHIRLMELLTAGRFDCELDDGMLDESILNRYTESLQISPWVESMVWPFYEWAERTTEPIPPIQLLIDVMEDQVDFSFSHPNINPAIIACDFRLKLLGGAQGVELEEWSSSLQVA
ncbi:MAG: hypothetical protein P8K81_05190 [Flavobacteriales bacterium]|nr:hypothetical protein [Flavobacteriales bacterium]